MKKTVPIIAALAVSALVVVAGVHFLLNDGNGSGYSEPMDLVNTPPSQWSYVGGDVGSFGVTDSKTPITESEMKLAWKTTDTQIDMSGNVWKTPSSAICVEDSAFFFTCYNNTLYRYNISTGAEIAHVECDTTSVYNMAIAYGDGKIFICAYDKPSYTTVMHAYDANSLEQLFVSSPVSGGEVQGTITYNDGKVYFGTYDGDYACFASTDTDTSRPDEAVKPIWLLKSTGWYNATPAFFDDMVVIVQRGFDTGGATAYLVDSDTGIVIDTVSFDREYSSSGATAYERRVYIPLSRVIDRSILQPKTETPKHLSIHSFVVTDEGFVDSSERFWESDCAEGSTQSIPVIWNGTIYIGGGGLTTGSDEPFWIIDIANDGSMTTRASFPDIKTKGTAAITTAYATEENGYAVYIYLMEYGHVFPGEDILSTKGYADIFVIRDSKTTGAEVIMTLRPDPAQFNFQSFSISRDGHVLIRNDTTLFCFGTSSEYTSSDVSSTISRFLSMSDNGHTNYADYQRIVARYNALSDEDKAKVTNYPDLEDHCVSLNLETASGMKTITVPKGCTVDIPSVSVPNGKTVIGWKNGDDVWHSYSDRITSDTTLKPIHSDLVTVTADPDNGGDKTTLKVAKDSKLPYIEEPVRPGYRFAGWITDSDDEYASGETLVTTNLTIYAKWLPTINLKFDTDGGSEVKGTYKVEKGKAIGRLPTTVIKSGYSFDGWYYGEEKITIETTYKWNSQITLKAKWIANEERQIDNGHGVAISGKLPIGATIEVTVPPNGTASPSSVTDAYMKDLEREGGADCLRIYLSGDGVTPDLNYTVSIDVTHADGTIPVYYFDETGSVKVTGTISGGKLTFTLSGDKESLRMISITFATSDTLGITGHTG